MIAPNCLAGKYILLHILINIETDADIAAAAATADDSLAKLAVSVSHTEGSIYDIKCSVMHYKVSKWRSWPDGKTVKGVV